MHAMPWLAMELCVGMFVYLISVYFVYLISVYFVYLISVYFVYLISVYLVRMHSQSWGSYFLKVIYYILLVTL